MRSYLLVFNASQATRRLVTSRLDSISEITNWIAFFDNTVCVVSEVDVKALSDLIRAALPGVQFIITELQSGKKQGWLPKSIWKFMNAPAPAATEAAE